MPDNDKLFLPGLVEPEARPWTVNEVAIREAAVDLQARTAWVPRALTPAQKLARLHELGHVKYTPRNWSQHMAEALSNVDEGADVDPAVIVQISMMLEENRIDWLLWDRHQIDLRPAREVLDWDKMAVPTDVLRALKWVLQLAWTVWASKGLHHTVPNRPPAREPDSATGDFFDACWLVLANHHADLAPAVVRGCLAIYNDPTHATRNSVAAELATFFPPEKEIEEQPPEKEEEQEAQAEAAKEAKAEEKSRHRNEEPEEAEPEVLKVPDPKTDIMYLDIHDHTANVHRISTKIRRRVTPTYSGILIKYPHRYMVDKAIFGLRTLTEGGLMLDWSGSMQWTDQDLQDVLAVLPAITVGGYGGFSHPGTRGHSFRPFSSRPEGGRICIVAKHGKFSKFAGLESLFNGGNAVDVEALQLLGRWPKPRFWLSDGFVCGGQHQGAHPERRYNTNDIMRCEGNVAYECEKLMRKYEILRVPNVATLRDLLKRKRVTLFASPVNHSGEGESDYWFSKNWPESPVRFQL
jgi:hypothetical protein